jgi:hypothetical protein
MKKKIKGVTLTIYLRLIRVFLLLNNTIIRIIVLEIKKRAQFLPKTKVFPRNFLEVRSLLNVNKWKNAYTPEILNINDYFHGQSQIDRK